MLCLFLLRLAFRDTDCLVSIHQPEPKHSEAGEHVRVTVYEIQYVNVLHMHVTKVSKQIHLQFCCVNTIFFPALKHNNFIMVQRFYVFWQTHINWFNTNFSLAFRGQHCECTQHIWIYLMYLHPSCLLPNTTKTWRAQYSFIVKDCWACSILCNRIYCT